MIIPLQIVISDKLRICESRLVGDINDSVTSLSVTSGEGSTNFPSYVPFLVLIESEIVNVTDKSTDTFTIVRAYSGTTAASHTSGTPLRAIVYSDDIDQIIPYLGL